MKAVVRTEYGSPDAMRVIDRDRPEPGPKQVRVRVEAAGVDIGVWHLLTGLPTMARLALGLRSPREPGLGSELAGVVDAVGSQVTRFRPGDAVFGVGTATFAEYALAPEKNLVPRPAGVSAPQAASSAISGVTAVQALGTKPFSRVLILGASGGVGSFATQFAKAAGAHVTAVASTAKLDFVRGLGADEVLDYTATDPVDGSRTYDLILEMGGIRSDSALRRGLTPDGRAVIVGGEGGGRVTGGFLGSMTAGLRSTFRRQKVTGLVSLTSAADLERVAAALSARDVVPAIDAVLPLAEAAEALRRLESRRVRGKLVIDPAG
jgi:NADPH:quinone reductase-like Zn-dependent oxidoreductase